MLILMVRRRCGWRHTHSRQARTTCGTLITGSVTPTAKTKVTPTPVNKRFKFSADAGKHGLYSNAPYRYTGAKSAGKAPADQIIWVEQQDISSTGTIWYYGMVNGKKVWFDSKAGSVMKVTDEKQTNVKQYFKVNQAGRTDYMYIGAPHGYAGTKTVGRIPNNAIIWVEKSVKSSTGTVWYYGNVNGTKAWFVAQSGAFLKVTDVKHTAMNLQTTFNQKSRKDGLYTVAPHGFVGATNVGRPTDGAAVKIEKKLVNDGITWYYGKVNGKYVWFDAKAVYPVVSNVSVVNKRFKLNQTGRSDVMYTTSPYGYVGSKSAGRVPNGQTIWIDKQEKAANGTVWYYATINGKKVWFDAKAGAILKVTDEKSFKVNKYFKFNQTGRNDYMYAVAPHGYENTKTVSRVPNGTVVWIENTVQSATGTYWHYGQVNNQKVWFASQSGAVLKVTDVNQTKMNVTMTFDQRTRKDGLYATSPYGFAGASSVGNPKNGVNVKIEKKLVNPSGTTWYYGKVNGKYVWFDSKAVKPVVKKTAMIVPGASSSEAKKESDVSSSEKVETKSSEKQESKMKTEEDARVTQPLNVDFVFDQATRTDKMYKDAPRGEKTSSELRNVVDGEIVHVTAQFVAEDGTIWYNTEIKGESVWFEVGAGRIKA